VYPVLCFDKSLPWPIEIHGQQNIFLSQYLFIAILCAKNVSFDVGLRRGLFMLPNLALAHRRSRKAVTLLMEYVSHQVNASPMEVKQADFVLQVSDNNIN
jgi:hypothetical protein